jgi:hypothetical protein
VYITDNEDPKKRGTYLSCKTYVVFCNGLSKRRIYDEDNVENTDCDTEGIAGTPGVGICPK